MFKNFKPDPFRTPGPNDSKMTASEMAEVARRCTDIIAMETRSPIEGMIVASIIHDSVLLLTGANYQKAKSQE